MKRPLYKMGIFGRIWDRNPNRLLFKQFIRTESSPIRSVIIRVINKIGQSRSGSLICLITSMIFEKTKLMFSFSLW